MKRISLWAAVLGVFFVVGDSGQAHAGPPPRWSFQRASFGIDAKAAILRHDGDQSAFLPGAYLSYSATSQLSFAGTIERDFAKEMTIGQGGFRVVVLKSERGQVAGGVNLVGYGDDGSLGMAKPTSYNMSVNGSWKAAAAKDGTTLLYGIASWSYDPQNNLKIARVGLRLQVIGGHPVHEPASF